MKVERRQWIRGCPQGEPGLVALRRMKSSAFLVIAFGGGEVEAFAHGQVVREKIASNGFFLGRAAGKHRHDIDDASAAVDTDQKGVDSLQWHEQCQGERSCDRAQPARPRHPPSCASTAPQLRNAIPVPRLRFAEIILEHWRAHHGTLCPEWAAAETEFGTGAFMGSR